MKKAKIYKTLNYTSVSSLRLIEEMWNFQFETTKKTYLLLCMVTFLFLYCANRLFKIGDLETHIHEVKHFETHNLITDAHVYINQSRENKTKHLNRTNWNRIKYPLFQSNEPAEFPHVVNGTTIIPHIIHQICDTTAIPDNFIGAMRSFVKQNPTWIYRFWTYKSGHLFLKKYHPYLVDIYDSFRGNNVRKSDLLRIAVLYEYGGVYADLDVKNLRPFDITTTKYACIIPTEPFEHAGFAFGRDFILSTSVLLCRPKHPFFKMLLKHLQFADPNGHPVHTTGPVYLTQMYMLYNNLTAQDVSKSILNDTRSNSPYFYKGTRDAESEDGVYIPNSQYFGDNVDPGWVNEQGDLKECVNNRMTFASVLQQRACKEFESRKVIRKEKRFTFTFHYWFHLWTYAQEFVDHLQKNDIKDVLPNAVLFAGVDGCGPTERPLLPVQSGVQEIALAEDPLFDRVWLCSAGAQPFPP